MTKIILILCIVYIVYRLTDDQCKKDEACKTCGYNDWANWEGFGFTYQQRKCKVCGSMKVIEKD